MGKWKRGKGRHKAGAPVVSGPFAGTYWHLRRLAGVRRLFILFDGEPAAPRLTVFDTARGVALVDYWPKSRLWSYADRPGRGGQCEEHADVIAVAVQVQKADKSQFGAARVAGT
jgi:hypothetical protein